MHRDRSVREKVDRYVTDVSGTDNRIQWALFMPDFVKKQVGDSGIDVVHFEYRTLPAFRFIGVGAPEPKCEKREEIMRVLDAMPEYASGFDYDIFFTHEEGKAVEEHNWHGLLGRFMKAGAPVPDGFSYFDFLSPDSPRWSDAAGPPYLRQFAFAVFSGEGDEPLRTNRAGFDGDVMYDTTRNIILGEDVTIPYPENYWTAEI
jgi:hypothetical protein